MTRAGRLALAGATCAVALLRAFPAPADGGEAAPRCICSERVAPLDALEFYDLVFFGEASFVGLSEDDPARGADEFVEFATEGLWKGPVQRRLRVYTSDADPRCAFSFTPGKRYLVFAKLEDAAWSNRYRTSACARTAPADRALPDLAILGEPPQRLTEADDE